MKFYYQLVVTPIFLKEASVDMISAPSSNAADAIRESNKPPLAFLFASKFADFLRNLGSVATILFLGIINEKF
jgi:hypothetical protein